MITYDNYAAAALADVRQAVVHATTTAAGVGRAAGGLVSVPRAVSATASAAMGLCGTVAASSAAARVQRAGGFTKLPRGSSLSSAGGTPVVNTNISCILRVAIATVRAAVINVSVTLSSAATAAVQFRTATSRHTKSSSVSARCEGTLSTRTDNNVIRGVCG